MMVNRSRWFLAEIVRVLVPVLILAAGIGGFLVFGQRMEAPSQERGAPKKSLVETAVVTPFVGPFTIEVEGVVVPFREIRLSAEVAGRIVRKSPDCRAGSYVAKNTFLLEIDDTDYRLEVERLQAQLDQANEAIAAVDVDLNNTAALIALAEEDLQLRQKDLTRIEALAKHQALSESQVDDTHRLELTSRNALQSLQNQRAALQQRRKTLTAACHLAAIQLKRAQADLQRTRVVSPITGSVRADPVEQDDYVRKGDLLVQIIDTSQVEVQCSLRIEELYWIWRQADARRGKQGIAPEARYELPPTPVQVVYTLGGTEYLWDGVLSRYEGTGLDQQTRTVPCRVLVAAPTTSRVGERVASGPSVPPPALFNGMYVTLRIPIQPPDPLLVLPIRAIRPGRQVWVVRGGKLQIIAVDVARTESDRVLVRSSPSGLVAGEKVISSPLSAAMNGMPVQEVIEP